MQPAYIYYTSLEELLEAQPDSIGGIDRNFGTVELREAVQGADLSLVERSIIALCSLGYNPDEIMGKLKLTTWQYKSNRAAAVKKLKLALRGE